MATMGQASAAHSMALVCKLLEPVQTTAQLGKNMQQNQPDVEALAFLTRDFALTEAKHGEMRIPGKDWLSLQVCIVGVSKAGFSRVPYQANKKKGEKEPNQKGLYEDVPVGTSFYTFEKGKTNKDRGERVETIELDGGETANGFAVVDAGMCFSAFMRQDIYGSDSKFFVDDAGARTAFAEDGVLRKHSFVYLQLSSQNVNQARQGNLVKIKRMKLVTDPVGAVADLASSFPDSLSTFDDLQEVSRNNPVLSKQIYSGNNAFFAVTPAPAAFVCIDESEQFFVCSKVGAQGIDSMKIPLKVMCDATNTSDALRACKIATIAIAMQAVRLIVQSNERNSVIMNGDGDAWAQEAVFMHVDPNKMLGLDDIAEFNSVSTAVNLAGKACLTGPVLIKYENERVTWMITNRKVRLESGQDRSIVFSVGVEKRMMLDSQSWNKGAARFLSDGCAGDYHKLSVFFVDTSQADWTDAELEALRGKSGSGEASDLAQQFLSLKPPLATPILTLQMFPGLASVRCSKKRPRFDILDNTLDSFSEVEESETQLYDDEGQGEGPHEDDEQAHAYAEQAERDAGTPAPSKRRRRGKQENDDTSDEA